MTVKPCRHGDRHPHGDRTRYTEDGCRCPDCSAAAARYDKRRAYARHRGTWDGLVPVDAARAHGRAVVAAGVTVQQIAASTGIPLSTLGHILYSTKARRTRASREAAILAVPLTPPPRMVDATGTRRRLQALMRLGYNRPQLARELGVIVVTVYRWMTEDQVTPAAAAKVSALYDRLWQTLPVERTSRDKHTAARARNWAISRGWSSPLAWDDDAIDDPSALPDGDVGPNAPKRPARRVDLDEVLERTLDGDTTEQIAAAFGVTRDAVTTAVRRHKRADIRRRLDHNDTLHAARTCHDTAGRFAS